MATPQTIRDNEQGLNLAEIDICQVYLHIRSHRGRSDTMLYSARGFALASMNKLDFQLALWAR
jgi:hypothetical protein